jgi:hypothetical protein
MFQWLKEYFLGKKVYTEEQIKKVPEQIKKVPEQINEDPEPNNVIIIYNEDGNEIIDRYPLPAKFNKLIEDHTTTDLCELIDFCNGVMKQRPTIIYVDKNEKSNVINNLESLWWPDTEKNLPLNKVSELPDNCILVLVYKKGIEIHVY